MPVRKMICCPWPRCALRSRSTSWTSKMHQSSQFIPKRFLSCSKDCAICSLRHDKCWLVTSIYIFWPCTGTTCEHGLYCAHMGMIQVWFGLKTQSSILQRIMLCSFRAIQAPSVSYIIRNIQRFQPEPFRVHFGCTLFAGSPIIFWNMLSLTRHNTAVLLFQMQTS